MSPKPPNVLLITTDQHRGDCIEGGGRGVRTPNLQRIADRGARFDCCITPNPMCQPARASILTGKLPYSHGVRDNGRDLDLSLAEAGLGGVFAAAGYATHLIGKAHLSTHETFAPTGRPECYHSVVDLPADWTGPYAGFETVELILRPHHHCGWRDDPNALHYERFLDQDGCGRERWEQARTRAEPLTDHKQVWRSALEDRWQTTAWVGDRALDMLDGAGDRPILAWISFPDPHPPFQASEPWATLYPPETVDLPPHRHRDLDSRPWWHRAFLESPVRRAQKRQHAAEEQYWGSDDAPGDRDLRDVTAVYYGMIGAVDFQVGRILNRLEAEGWAQDTIVVFTADHGEWLGDHGLLLKGPMLYDGLLRVPLVMAGPGIPQGRFDAPVSTLDLLPTLAALCGMPVRPTDGRALTDVLGGASRDVAQNEWAVDPRRSGVELDLRTVRSRQHRLTVDLKSGAGELYDLTEDPFETRNRWDDPGGRAVRDAMLGTIAAHRPGMIPAAPRVGWH